MLDNRPTTISIARAVHTLSPLGQGREAGVADGSNGSARRQGGATAAPSRPNVIWPVTLGIVALLGLFGGLAAWSARAPLASAAIAPGQVAIDTNRKSIQHLEGGIVARIRIRESQRVHMGQVLVELDETRARASAELLKERIGSVTHQFRLIGLEIADVQTLYKKGLARRPRLLALLRRQAELDGKRRQDVARLRATRYQIARSKIRAPMNGTIVGLQVNTIGGVIAPGATLMSIVPRDETLVIEARVDPNDIDVVKAGLDARVRLTPFSARQMLPIAARVVSVSADRLTDERSGSNYYRARVVLNEAPSNVMDGAKLYPGMPVEVMIVTGKRTLLEYLIAPVSRSFRRAFREQ